MICLLLFKKSIYQQPQRPYHQIMGINQLSQATLMQIQVRRHANGNISSLGLIEAYSSEVISLGHPQGPDYSSITESHLWSLRFVLGLLYTLFGF